MLTLTLPARPLVAIPGGVLATLAWWVAASAARDELMTLTAVASLALGCCTAAYAVHDALLGAARERGRLAGQAERERRDRADRWPRHEAAADTVRDENSGGVRCSSPLRPARPARWPSG